MGLAGRIVGGIAGLILIAIGLLQLFGDPSLPNCGGSDTVGVLRDIMIKGVPANLATDQEATKSAIAISDAKEVSYDEAKQLRSCTAVGNLTVGESKVFENLKLEYTLEWQDRAKNEFLLRIQKAQ